MKNISQELFTDLNTNYQTILTSLLSSEDVDNWNKSKYLIVSHNPFLTLEMAVNRVCQRNRKIPPTPAQIYSALQYAKEKSGMELENSQTDSISID